MFYFLKYSKYEDFIPDFKSQKYELVRKRPNFKRSSDAKIASWKRDQKLSNPALSEYEILPSDELRFCQGFKIKLPLILIQIKTLKKYILERPNFKASKLACVYHLIM